MATDFLTAQNTITIFKGTSKTLLLKVKDSKLKDFDITGATIYFSVKAVETDTNTLISKNSSDIASIEITSPREGIAKIYLSPSDTKNLSVKQYVFDVFVILASGKRYVAVPPSPFDIKATVTVLA